MGGTRASTAVLFTLFFAVSSARAGDTIPGVSNDAIVVGQPAAFSGASAGLGVELWRGMHAAVMAVNDKGGVHNRRLRLELCDDRYEPTDAAKCAHDLAKKRGVFVLANSVGTPTIYRIVRLLKSWADEHVYLFGNFTGAQIQREMPYAPYVFNVRASYHQEVAGHIRACLDAGRSKIGTFVQEDVFGKDGEEGVRLGLAERGSSITERTYYDRGTTFEQAMHSQVSKLRSAGVDCVSTTGSYQGVAAFIRDARGSGWDIPVYAVSFTGADQLLALLKKAGEGATKNVFMTQVVPNPNDASLPLVREYRRAMETYRPQLPPPPYEKGGYTPSGLYSFGSLEGFLNTKLLIEALERTGPQPTRPKFKDAVESIKRLDIGLGSDVLVSWGKVTGNKDRYNHQALTSVWLSAIEHEQWVFLKN